MEEYKTDNDIIECINILKFSNNLFIIYNILYFINGLL